VNLKKIRSILEGAYEHRLMRECNAIPCHIALIQDGNRRFAEEHGIDTAAGHRMGAETTECLLGWAQELGIRHITLYTFSTENFKRDKDELHTLFSLFREKLKMVTEDDRVHKNRVCIQIIGDRSLLPADLQECIERAEALTSDYEDYFINIALAYGGRNEIVHATKSILSDVRDGEISPDNIDVDLIDERIHKGLCLPPVDLIIRTGNDQRTSNFLPWLANGNESAVYFCAPYWPSFRKIDLLRAIRLYDQRLKNSA